MTAFARRSPSLTRTRRHRRGVARAHAHRHLGLPAGHWRHTETTGAFKKTTYFDARFRPVLSLEEDTANAATKRYVARCFDHEGRETFAGYPVASFGSLSPTTTCTGAGVETVYDAPV